MTGVCEAGDNQENILGKTGNTDVILQKLPQYQLLVLIGQAARGEQRKGPPGQHHHLWVCIISHSGPLLTGSLKTGIWRGLSCLLKKSSSLLPWTLHVLPNQLSAWSRLSLVFLAWFKVGRGSGSTRRILGSVLGSRCGTRGHKVFINSLKKKNNALNSWLQHSVSF